MKIELVKTGFERYYTVDGKKCPSVTQVVSYHEDKRFLEDWKARNPLKADTTSSSAGDKGSTTASGSARTSGSVTVSGFDKATGSATSSVRT